MSRPVAITAVATWTPGGVSVGGPPRPAGSGSALASWPDAPKLATIHPRARRPSGAAKAVVQLAHALFEDRRRQGPFDIASTSICVGSMSGCAIADTEFADALLKRGDAFGSPSTFVYTLPTTVLGEIAIALGIRGEIASISAGEASGLSAVAVAAANVASGRLDACLCGGIEISTAGAHRVFAREARDSIAFFLLEPVEGTGAPLRTWRTGFGAPPPGGAWPGDLGNGPLLELASAVGNREGLLASVAPEGFWATVAWGRRAPR